MSGIHWGPRCATALAAALALGGLPGLAAAQSTVTLWGGADLGMRSVHNSAGSKTSMQSGNNYTSRFGLRGSEDLGGGLKVSFWLESTANLTTGSAGAGSQFWDRRATLSLSGGFGELRLGRDYTPMFRAFAGTDVFGYVGVAGMGTLYSAGASNVVARAFGSGATSLARTNAAVQYYTPNTLGGFYFNGMYAHQGSGTVPGDFDFWGARAGYAAGPIDVSLYGGSTQIKASDEHFRLYGMAGSYALGAARFKLGAVRMAYLDARQTNYTVGVDWAVGVGQIRATYHRINQSGAAAGGASVGADDANVFGLGYVHNLSKRTALYGTAAFVTNQGSARFVLPGSLPGATGGRGSRGFEVGLRHIF